MANYLSKPADYGNYTQPINLDLVNFVMQSKQQKYDYNLAKLESKISDELGSIDLARTQDKEYFLNRASEALSSVGNISKIDFSSNSAAKQLDSKINSVVDDRVLNDVISTSNYRSFQSTVQQKQKEDPDLYSTTNIAYAMEKQGVNSWLNGTDKEGNKVDSLGQVTYEDYVDVGAELKDISENLDKFANVVKENTPEGLYFKNVEGKYLSAEEIRQIASQQLTSKAQRQMKINGWANYDGGNAQAQSQLKDSFSTFADSRLSKIDKIIAEKELQLKSLGNSNSDLKDNLISQIESYKDNKRQTKESYESWINNNNLDSMSSTLETNRVLDSFSNTFAFDNRGISYSTNQAALALQKIQMQAALKKKEGAGGIEGLDVTELPATTPDRDEFANAAAQSEKWDSQFKQAVNAEFNKLSETEKEGILQDYKEGSVQSKEEFILEKLEALPGNKVINQVTLSQIDELRLKKESYQETYNLAVKKGFEKAETGNISKIVEEYYDNTGIEMTDEKGNVISVAKYLEVNGITSKNGSTLNDPEKSEVKNRILQHYYADKILSKGIFEGFQQKFDELRVGIAENLQSSGIRSFGNTPEENAQKIREIKEKKYANSEEDAMYMGRLLELTGSVEAAEKFISESKSKGLYDTNSGVDSYIKSTGLGAGILSAFNRDNSITDDNVLNKWIDVDKIKTEGGKYLNEEKLRPGKRNLAVNVKIDSDIGERVVGLLRSGVNTVNGEVAQFNINKDAGSVAIYEGSADTAIISGSAKVDGNFVPYSIEVYKRNLPEDLRQVVSFEADRPIFDRTTMKPLDSQVSFKTMDDRRAFLDASYFTGSEEIALTATKDGLLENLYSYYPDVMGSKVNPSPYAKAVNNMLNSNNVFVKIEKEDNGDFYTNVVSKDLKTNKETSLYSEKYPIPEEDYDEAYRKVKRVPQLYVAQVVNDVIDQAQINPENPSETMVNILKLYGE